MESAQLLGLALKVQHRHGGEWVTLEERIAHDPAASDPERGWAAGRIYACQSCEEQVRVLPPDRPPNG